MASLYPVSLDSLPTTHTDNTSEVIHAATDNDQSDAINHIELELGVAPRGVYADVAGRFNILEHLQLNGKNLTTYTLVLGDKSKVINMINPSPSVLTIPTNASVAFPIGTQIMVRQSSGAGTVTIAGATGVTVQSRGSSLALAGVFAWVTLIKVNTDTWDVIGDLA